MNSASTTHVAIVGAGPYGLSLAAHLRESGVPFRIFGQPMQSWATQMPNGMKLKSDGFASNLYSGSIPFTLEDFCQLTGRPYHSTDLPVAVEDFVAYGQEFQRRFVPTLDQRNVAAIDREGSLFSITLADGARLHARHIVIATGVSLFQYLPDVVRSLPAALVTHSTDHKSFEDFAGADVTVLGRGASSLNAAVLLHEDGANVTVLTRSQKVHIQSAESPSSRSLYQRLRRPSSPLGNGMRSWLTSNAPGVFRLLPYALRRILTYKHLGPSGGTALKGRIEGRFPILTGWSIEQAEFLGNDALPAERIRLTLSNALGESREHRTGHIIAGTGFRYDLSRLRFLSVRLLDEIQRQPTGAPVLDSRFGSTAPGITFIGPAAATSFGPLLRFACGAGYAAERVAARLVRDYARLQPRKAATSALDPTPIAR